MVFRVLTMIVVMFLLLGLYKWRIYQEEQISFANRIAQPEEFRQAATIITEAAMIKFVVDEEFSPPLPVRKPNQELARIVFTAEDYNKEERSYQKSVTSIEGKLDHLAAEFSNENYSSINVLIVDPEKKGWAYYGKLQFDTGDPEREIETLNKDHRAWVVASPEQQP